MSLNKFYLLMVALIPLTTLGMKSPGTPEAQQALQKALKSQNVTQLQKALELGADVNSVEGPFQMNALHFLLDQEKPLTENQLKQLDMLLDYANLDTASGSGDTPLHFAAAHGHIKALEHMANRLSKEAINKPNLRGWTPLHRAAYGTHFDVIRLLKSLGADPTLKDKDGNTPLHILAQRNIRKAPGTPKDKTFDPLLVEWMVTKEANKAGNTVLDIAAINQSPELVKAILATKKIEPWKVKKDTPTALHKAISTTMNPEVVALLIKAGTPVDQKDKNQQTVLHLLAIKMSDLEKIAKENNWPIEETLQQHEEIVKLLKEAGISKNPIDNFGKTALDYAEGSYTNQVISSV